MSKKQEATIKNHKTVGRREVDGVKRFKDVVRERNLTTRGEHTV